MRQVIFICLTIVLILNFQNCAKTSSLNLASNEQTEFQDTHDKIDLLSITKVNSLVFELNHEYFDKIISIKVFPSTSTSLEVVQNISTVPSYYSSINEQLNIDIPSGIELKMDPPELHFAIRSFDQQRKIKCPISKNIIFEIKRILEAPKICQFRKYNPTNMECTIGFLSDHHLTTSEIPKLELIPTGCNGDKTDFCSDLDSKNYHVILNQLRNEIFEFKAINKDSAEFYQQKIIGIKTLCYYDSVY